MARSVRKLIGLQLLLTAVTSVVFFLFYGGFQAGSVWYGGATACAGSLLLAWRRHGADSGRALSAGESIRVLYRTALERFVLVAVLFAVGLGALQLDAPAVLTGFILGQLALFIEEYKGNTE